MNPEFWRNRRVLVTGHTGFKGAWLSLWLESLGAQLVGIALPAEHQHGAFAAMSPWDTLTSWTVDLTDREAVVSALASAEPEVVFHLAAQALVRRGYRDPYGTFVTNVQGTANLLDGISSVGSVKAAVIVTTDKVYASSHSVRPFREDDPLGGRDPYSSSKACVEVMVNGWRRRISDQVGLAMCTARSGNVIGGGDWAEDRLVPDSIRAFSSGATLTLRHPDAIRPWLFVLDPLLGYLEFAEKLHSNPDDHPSALNFGPSERDRGVTVSRIANRIAKLWGHGEIRVETDDRFPESPMLQLDASRAGAVLGWRQRVPVDDALSLAVDWYRAQQDGEDLRSVSLMQLATYQERLAL